MNPQIFGPPTWEMLFYLVQRCDTMAKRRTFISIMYLLQKLLSCGTCRQHLTDTMNSYDISPSERSTNDLMYYVYFIKTLADKNKPGYRAPNIASVKEKYARMSRERFLYSMWKATEYIAITATDENAFRQYLMALSAICPYNDIANRIRTFTTQNSFRSYRSLQSYVKAMRGY